MFARRHADDIGDGGRPHAPHARGSVAAGAGGAMFAEGLFHLIAELAAKIERQNPQQPAEKAVPERLLLHLPSYAGLNAFSSRLLRASASNFSIRCASDTAMCRPSSVRR